MSDWLRQLRMARVLLVKTRWTPKRPCRRRAVKVGMDFLLSLVMHFTESARLDSFIKVNNNAALLCLIYFKRSDIHDFPTGRDVHIRLHFLPPPV